MPQTDLSPLQKHWISPILPCCSHFNHVRLFHISCSWGGFEALNQTSSLGLGSASDSHGSYSCRRAQSNYVPQATFYGSVCLWECSRRTPRWIGWPRRSSYPSASRLDSHHLNLLLILAAQSQRKAISVFFVFLLMHERWQCVFVRWTRSFHLHVYSNLWLGKARILRISASNSLRSGCYHR